MYSVLCEISKIYFVKIDCDDALCYCKKLESFWPNVGKYDKPFEATIVCRKIVLVAVESIHYDMDCN